MASISVSMCGEQPNSIKMYLARPDILLILVIIAPYKGQQYCALSFVFLQEAAAGDVQDIVRWRRNEVNVIRDISYLFFSSCN